MAAWPTLFVAMDDLRGEFVCIAATAAKARRVAEEKFNGEEYELSVEEVPLADAVKVLRIPAGPLPGTVPAPAAVRPADEPASPARRSDPETAQKAAAAARKLGPNRRTEILRGIVRLRDYRVYSPGFTASEVCASFGGEPGTVSKRLGELIDGAWLYVEGERPAITTGVAQRVLHPTWGAISWCQEHPTSGQEQGR